MWNKSRKYSLCVQQWILPQKDRVVDVPVVTGKLLTGRHKDKTLVVCLVVETLIFGVLSTDPIETSEIFVITLQNNFGGTSVGHSVLFYKKFYLECFRFITQFRSLVEKGVGVFL